MNNFNNVHDFLKQNQKLHSRIAEFYQSLSKDAENQRTKLLLDILIKHELELLDFISNYLDKASDKTQKAFIQFDPEQNLDALFSTDFNRTQVTSEQVEALADRFNQYLSDIYQGISKSNESQEVKIVFDNLHQHTEQKKKQLSIELNEMHDI
ncbi:hypothetical protein [Psychromonas sp. 14N.309.X.WAT.B.A12]|uniref:hypothetical protein n=2 Tax=Psychromonas TaxID=67572 RepID=UPI0025AED065|nr:hypothetical protein [Psychromonas sp. 14N.309.X.WAT.B.A12]MDN2662692.1 hypothetical protein [Psychromonas sp. 14N.309.X.WAT.B.A12]